MTAARNGIGSAWPWLTVLVAVCVAQGVPGLARAQDLGHKLVGTLGLDAGSMPPPGLYFGDRLVYYAADEVRDRNGNVVEIPGFELDALGNALGIAGVVPLPELSARLGAALAVPIASISVNSQLPAASIDRFGFGDVAIKPFQIGFELDCGSALAEYTLYVPTGHFELRGNSVSLGHVTHQVSLGGTVAFDAAQRWFAAALLSYDHNQRKRGIDIRRGDTLQVQGGAGMRPTPALELGVAAFGLWQVSDDEGSDLPAVLRGSSERAYGLGPEVALQLQSIGLGLRARYMFEFGVTSRPIGHIATLGLNFVAATLE